MLKQLLLVALVGTALGQRIPDWLRPYVGSTTYRVDDVHGHVVEYDDAHDLILLVGRDNCYLVDAPDSTWDSIVRDKTQIEPIAEAIYHQILENEDMRLMTHPEAINMYHSRIEQWQCNSKDIYKSPR